jgi:periplasmic protein TonB
LAQNSTLGVFLDDKAHERFLEILFENRNRSYGAFFLRRTYSRRVMIGTIATVVSVVFILLMPYIVDALRPKPRFDLNTKYIPVVVDEFPAPPGQMAYMPEFEVPKETLPEITRDTVREERKDPPKPVTNQPNPNADTAGKNNGPPGGAGIAGGAGPYGAGVNTLPIPPGGKGGNIKQMIMDWTDYVRTHLRYPEEAKRKGIKGKVIVNVNIAKDGTVMDARIRQSVSPELDKAALDMVNAMPKWQPAIRNGWPAVQPLDLSVDFGLVK